MNPAKRPSATPAPSVRSFARVAAPPAARGVPPSSQVTALASREVRPPLRTADHPATPWWSALLRGGDGAEARAELGFEVLGSGGRAGRTRKEEI